jgi:glycosyltransferase involved in cell wall biosynthesis
MISYILPTRDRPERLALTLAALGNLKGHPQSPDGPGEVLIVDNASRFPATAPDQLANGLRCRVLHRASNEGAASRTTAVQHADPRSEWVVMLDDDSYPCDTGFIRRLSKAPPDVAAVSADIYLPGMARRESGGLPEVFVGCGVAIRRRVYLDLGGYDPAFNYYAEEYDLAARMILAGYRIAFDPWFRVEHHKVALHRDMNTIMARLVRNNGWVMQRYAPEEMRRAQIREQRTRYRQIAIKENGLKGFTDGLLELRRTIRAQKRTPMPRHLFDRFTGLAYAREALQAAYAQKPFRTVQLVDEGKNGWVVRKALAELGVTVIEGQRTEDSGMSHSIAPSSASTQHSALSPQHSTASDALVLATMSPGPLLDAFERRTLLNPAGARERIIAPWIAITRKPAAGADILTGGAAKVA